METIEKLNKKECTGCTACLNTCPSSAISLSEREPFGHIHPVISHSSCVKCGKCYSVCPSINGVEYFYPKSAFAAINVNTSDYKNSSSGGLFILLANLVIEKGGAVFGAKWDLDNKRVVHYCATNKTDLFCMQKSKYIQSHIGNTFKQALSFLKSKKTVLFSGTPCQIAGLIAFVGKAKEYLITVDLACHGVPSQKLFEQYLDTVYKNEKIISIDYRYKNHKNGHYLTRIVYKNIFGRTKTKMCYWNGTSYMSLFMHGYTLRESCYDCRYSKMSRVSDITLADFWGIETIDKKFYRNEGCSLLLVNTEKGMSVFQRICNCLDFKEVPIPVAVKGNDSLNGPSKKPNDYDYLASVFAKNGYSSLESFYEKNLKKKSDGILFLYHKYMPLFVTKMFSKLKARKK